MKKILFMTVALLGALALPAIAAEAAADDPVVARINNDVIHRSDVMQEMQMMGPQAQQIPPQMIFPQLLDRMIAAKLLTAKGYAEGLENSKEVKEEVKNAERQIVAEDYIHRTIQPQITDARIKEFYDTEVVAKFKPQEEVRARHILVSTEAEADDIIKQLKDGADFAKLAEEKSKDTGSAKNGGDLNYFTHDSMVKPFADAAFAMKVGEVSSTPVKTEFGYHIIKVEDKRKSSPPPLDEVRAQIVNHIGQQLTAQLIKSLEAKAKIERFDMDGKPLKTADTAAPAAASVKP